MLLTEPSEQECSRPTSQAFVCLGVGRKSNYNSGAFYLSEISSGPVVWGACQDGTSKVKDKLLIQAPPITKKEAQCLADLFGFWRQHSPHLGVLTLLPSNQKSCWLSGAQRRRRLYSRLSATRGMRPSRSSGAQVSAADRDAAWSPWQAPQVNHSTGS